MRKRHGRVEVKIRGAEKEGGRYEGEIRRILGGDVKEIRTR